MRVQTCITKNRAEVKGQIECYIDMSQYGECLYGFFDGQLCWLGFDTDIAFVQTRFPQADITLNKLKKLPDISSLLLFGTQFQIAVWQSLLTINKGQIKTYQDIANDIGKAKAVRAVGSAVGKNPVSIYVPCHRVLPKSGGVGQYLWGSDKKREILKAEGVI